MKRILASNIPSSLSHLDKKTINYLIDCYYDNQITKELLKNHNINLNPSYIFQSFPSMVIKSRKCPNCNSPLWVDLVSKKALKSGLKNNPYCPKCNTFEKCPTAQSFISKDSSSEVPIVKDKFNFEDLTLNEQFFLHVLLQNGFSHENRTYTLKTYIDYPIAPSLDYLAKIIYILMDKKILVNRNFPHYINTQYIEERLLLNNKRIEGLDNLTFEINILNIERFDVYNKILNLTLDPLWDYKVLLNLYKDLAKEECKDYIRYSFDIIKTPCEIGDESFGSLANYFLDYYSTSQVFGLIDRCICYISREILAEKIQRPLASLYFLKALQSHGGKSVEQKWNISKQRRPFTMPESQLTKSLYKLLNIENGFDSVININLFINSK